MDAQIQDKSQIRLKGVRDGFWVTLDPSLPVNYIQEELTRIFNQLQHLASNSRVTLDVGDSEGYESVIEMLRAFLKSKFHVASVNVAPASPSPKEVIIPGDKSPKMDVSNFWRQHNSDALVIAGRVRSGQKITAQKHLVILGDVNPGSELIAGGDILIVGTLGGTALAGQPDNEAAIILAVGFKPIQIQIGGVIAVGLSTAPRHTIEFAHVEHGNIVVEDYIKTNPFGRLTWPEVR